MTISAALVGWLQSRFVVTITTSSLDDVTAPPPPTDLLAFDPTSGQWQHLASVSGGTGQGFVTDGRSVAWMGDAGGVSVLHSDRSLATAPPPGGVSAEDLVQYRLVPLAQGGYLLADVASLDRLSSDGQRWQQQPIPAGYVALAGTSDGSWFALARQVERDRLGGTILGSSISLFNAQTHTLVHVVGDGATTPMPAVGGLLLYLANQAWYRVDAAGHAQRVAAASTAVTAQTLSPDAVFTAGGCPLPRTLALPAPLAMDGGLTAGLAVATIAALSASGCAPFFGPIDQPNAAPELGGTDLDGWAWTSGDRVAAIVDHGDIGSSDPQQVLVIETPGSAPLQVALPSVP